VSEHLSTDERVALLTSNYSHEAPVYERRWAPSLVQVGKKLLDRLEIGAVSSALDLGTGTGALLPEIAARARRARVAGVDRSEGMIKLASRAFGRAVMDGKQLAFRNGSFDLVTMCFVLFHFPNPAHPLEEVARVLAPGGRVGVLTWAEEESWPAIDQWHEVLDEFGADPPESLMSQHDLVNRPEKVAGLLTAAGFSDVRTWSESLLTQWDLDGFMDFVTGMALSKRRVESLDPGVRTDCLARARERLGRLDPEHFLQSEEVVAAAASIA
jgi:ubiquinone/menaquinone biosynthesis C-methylase UbiE